MTEATYAPEHVLPGGTEKVGTVPWADRHIDDEPAVPRRRREDTADSGDVAEADEHVDADGKVDFAFKVDTDALATDADGLRQR